MSESASSSPSLSPSSSLSPSISPSVPARPGTNEVINPHIMMQFSDDGGFTWSNEYWRELGRIGQHAKTIYYDRLGSARDRVFRIMISDPVKVIISNAWIDIDEGRN